MITLQNFIFPEPGICTEQALYFRLHGGGYAQSRGAVLLSAGGRLGFDTYFNMFSLGKWHAACRLDGLVAEIAGSGRVEIRAMQAIPNRSWEVLYCEVLDLAPGTPCRADLSACADDDPRGVIFLEITALEDGVEITGGRFATGAAAAPDTWPDLAVSITTFRREQAVRDTVARLETFLDGFDHGDRVRVQVVDNGASAGITPGAHVVAIDNPNYGGAGGFARGLLEAERAGASHCLFMDDDASFHMENIARAYLFLALARDDRVALAGAMITNTHKWRMWENGALFDGLCHPCFQHTDLRDPGAVIGMEWDSARPRPANFYGGWWFFAFAIARAEHRPFPFFVRGDDISFSLMNDFDIHTLNGVVSFQDDFNEKESAQTLYLDLRSHLVHHLLTDALARSAMGDLKIALRFVARGLLRFHYGSAEAMLLSWEDMMRGPGFFDENIDMAGRRAAVGAMMEGEKWQEITAPLPVERRRLARRSGRVRHYLGWLTLNGHLLPFSGRFWDRRVQDVKDRAPVHESFGAAEITWVNATGDKAYTVRQSKARFFRLGWRTLRLSLRFLREHGRLKSVYRQGYDAMTSRAYWEDKLDLAPADRDGNGDGNGAAPERKREPAVA